MTSIKLVLHRTVNVVGCNYWGCHRKNPARSPITGVESYFEGREEPFCRRGRLLGCDVTRAAAFPCMVYSSHGAGSQCAPGRLRLARRPGTVAGSSSDSVPACFSESVD